MISPLQAENITPPFHFALKGNESFSNFMQEAVPFPHIFITSPLTHIKKYVYPVKKQPQKKHPVLIRTIIAT